jgi:hypothetical protein
MKFVRIAALLLAAAFALSCVTFNLGTIKTKVNETSETVITPELTKLLREIPKPKIVIRVPNPPSNVTEADRFNSYINTIEKVFLQSGYTMRDRALLENLMKSGNLDYKGIKDKIDTDLIIDVLALRFDGTTAVRSFFNKTTNQIESFATDQSYVECAVASLECRVTIVDRGQLGGLFTLKMGAADLQEYSIVVDGFRQNMSWAGQQATGMFPVLRLVIEGEQQKLTYTEGLAHLLVRYLSGPRG